MAVGDVLSDAGVSLPSFNMSGIGGTLTYVGVAFLFALVLLIGLYFLFQILKYNQKIVLWRKVNGVIVPAAYDKGMYQRVGTGGDYWLSTKRFKKVLPKPKIYAGKNLIWYYEREDGEWINFCIGDIDEQMKKAGAYYVDEDMRLQRLGIQKNLDARLVKESFWAKHGATIMMVLFVVVVTVCLVMMFKEMRGSWSAIQSAAESVEHLASSVDTMSARAGSGVVPLGTPTPGG